MLYLNLKSSPPSKDDIILERGIIKHRRDKKIHDIGTVKDYELFNFLPLKINKCLRNFASNYMDEIKKEEDLLLHSLDYVESDFKYDTFSFAYEDAILLSQDIQSYIQKVKSLHRPLIKAEVDMFWEHIEALKNS